MNSLSTQIRNLRNRQGVTQAELAAVIGVSVQAVSKWECGGTPDVTLLPAIADYFGVSIDELYGRRYYENGSLDTYLIQLLQNTPEASRMRRACEICWSIFKGVSGIPNVYTTHLTQNANPDDDTCTRCILCFDSGVGYFNARKDSPSIFLMPEPDEGYNTLIASPEALADLFRSLADEDFVRTLLFLYRRNPIPFSLEHVCSTLSIAHGKMNQILEQFIRMKWLADEVVELDSGKMKLYRPLLNEAMIALLYFSTEIIKKFDLWYMSNRSRSVPFLRDENTAKEKS